MKLTLFSVLPFVAIALSAAVPRKAVIVSYSDNTPDSVLQTAMDAIRGADGIITHEYSLIKGFAAEAPATVFEIVQTLGNEYHAIIEEEQIVSTLPVSDYE